MQSNDGRMASRVRTPEAEIFGNTLRRLRGEDVSQEKLAHAAGLTTSFMSELERGQKVPSLTTVLQLAHALDCSPADLLADFTPQQVRKIAKGRIAKAGLR